METKELKIQAPEGYEIDREESTLDCIKFKPIKKDITYEEIAEEFFDKNKFSFYITGSGAIFKSISSESMLYKNNATNKKQLKRILALNQLLNIAEYYNSNRKEDEVIYAIIYDFDECKFTVTSSALTDIYSFGVVTIFYNEDDAQSVIDNPNFREILDTIYKD